MFNNTLNNGKNIAQTLVVRPVANNKARAIVQFGPLRFQAAIGKNGRTAFKREGDGKSPIATMKLLYGFYRGDRTIRVPTKLPLRQIQKHMLWCDAPNDPNYNRPVKFPYRASHEELQREDGLYDICLVLDWNVTSRARGRGSAIFMHLIRPGYQPTAGCIALHPRDMKRLLPHLYAGLNVQIL